VIADLEKAIQVLVVPEIGKRLLVMKCTPKNISTSPLMVEQQ
jgi:hypothetical protein